MKKTITREQRQILHECLSCDRKDKLVQEYSNLIYQTVRKTLLIKNVPFSEQDVEDLHQEVFVQLFNNECRRLRQYKEDMCSLAGWIRLIANRTVLNHLRKRGFDTLSGKKHGIFIDEESDLLKHYDGFKTRENLLAMQDAIEKLPAQERLVLKLYCYKELSLPEIASYIHKKEGATYTIKSRAIKRLKKIMEES